MSTKRRRYLSYLLRLWQIESEGELVWRTSLESPQTGERTACQSPSSSKKTSLPVRVRPHQRPFFRPSTNTSSN
jgi:hypothetical protein